MIKNSSQDLISTPSPRQVKDYLLRSIPNEYWTTVLSIIGHEKFTRLKKIKQLGPISYVLGKGDHSRYDHSLGVAYFGLYFLRALMHKANINVSKRSEMVFVVACLCHDLGHGPLSHTFEFAMKYLGEQFDHESTGIDTLKSILKDNGTDLKQSEIDVIKNMISGEYDPEVSHGYPPFMFEILANIADKIDIDKMDYLVRDTNELGLYHLSNRIHSLTKKIISNAYIDKSMHISYEKCKNLKNELMLHRNYMFERYYGCEEAMVYNGLAVCMIIEVPDRAPIFGYTDEQVVEEISQKFDLSRFKNPLIGFESHPEFEKAVKFVKDEVGKKIQKKIGYDTKSIEIVC